MKQKAFTLVELLMVLAIIALLTTLSFVSLGPVREKARDARRFQDMNQITKALQLYWIDNEYYPMRTCGPEDGQPDCGTGGWETSDSGPEYFMEYLASYLTDKTPVDPINRRIEGFGYFGPRPGNYFYAYYRYDPQEYCQCDELSPTCKNIDRPFAILAVNNLEAYISQYLPEEDMPLSLEIKISRATCGDPDDDNDPEGEGICTVAEYNEDGQCRDWSQEFDYSIMLVE